MDPGDDVDILERDIGGAEYWRGKAKEWKEEFKEFQQGSLDLELELEAQLEETERRRKELETINNQLLVEKEQMRGKLEDDRFHIDEMEIELEEVKGSKYKLDGYVRELEQKNDDLERAKRTALATVEDLETRLNAAIEGNVFLELELDEKETLKL